MSELKFQYVFVEVSSSFLQTIKKKKKTEKYEWRNLSFCF